MCDSGKVFLHHGKGKKNKGEAEQKRPQDKRRTDGRKAGSIRDRGRLWRMAGIFCMAMAIGGVSLVLAVQVLAASGSLKAYGVSGDKGRDTGGRQDIQQRDTASANIAFAETGEGENTGEEDIKAENAGLETAEPGTEGGGASGGPLIIIDAGSGGTDAGYAAGDGKEGDMGIVPEKDINLAIAKKVQLHLEAMGYRVLVAGEGNQGADEEGKSRLINGSGADAYVGICQNVAEDQTVKGMEACYGAACNGDSKRLAQVVVQQAVKKTEAVERELQADYGSFIDGGASMPACLVRTGYLSNEEERGRLETEEYQEQAAEGIAQGIDYFFHPKTMYLTFDDGPTEENTSRVLDILKERNIKATFFVVGENVRRNPEVARRIVEEGHTIGIHCDNHAYDVVYESVDSFLNDFETAYETVKEVTGVEVKFFRFPGGSINAYNKGIRDELIEEMTKRGFIYFDWNASLEDAVRKATPEQLIANAVESTLGRKKVVMLAHDIIYNTGMCLEDLLDRLPEYRMEVLTEDVEPVQF